MSKEKKTVGSVLRLPGTGLWVTILILASLVFAANTAVSVWRATQFSNASAAVAELQVLSQQLANQAQDAVAGNASAFAQLRATRETIERSISEVDGRYGDDLSVKTAVTQLKNSWAPLSQSAGRIIESEAAVVGLKGNADELVTSVQSLQAELDEVLVAMANAGASPAQLRIATRQSALASSMVRRVAEIRAGGEAAKAAPDGLQQDVALFGQVMHGLTVGAENSSNAQKVSAPAAIAPLNKANAIWADMSRSLEAIHAGAAPLAEAQNAEATIVAGAEPMLKDARSLFAAFSASGSLRDSSVIGNIWISIGFGLLALIAIAGLLWSLYRGQVDRRASAEEHSSRNQEAIMRLLDEMGSLAEGDLTVNATVTEDMTGAIADSINFAIEQLRTLVGTINETSVQVAASAQETQSTAMHLAEAAEHQASEITSASQRINEIATSISEVSQNSAQSAEVAQRSVEIATNGAGVVRQTIRGMDNIRDQIQETSKRIKRLGESSQEIGAIVELINDISEQTNILALNASIQAASAGEAGRGFAVVADEVQRLAERTSGATRRIEGLVTTIQVDTNEAVSSMEETTSEVVSGARLAENAGTALGEIERVSNELAALIQNISEAAQQQSSAASEITGTMHTIQSITAQTSQGANQTAESIGHLVQLAANLRRSVADFKLPA